MKIEASLECGCEDPSLVGCVYVGCAIEANVK